MLLTINVPVAFILCDCRNYLLLHLDLSEWQATKNGLILFFLLLINIRLNENVFSESHEIKIEHSILCLSVTTSP